MDQEKKLILSTDSFIFKKSIDSKRIGQNKYSHSFFLFFPTGLLVFFMRYLHQVALNFKFKFKLKHPAS